MWRRAIRANSAAVKSPNPATSSLGGVVHGAATAWVSTPAPPARATTTRHCPDATSMAASAIVGIPRPLGRRVQGPRPSSKTASAAAAPTTPSTSATVMPASSRAPNAAWSAMDEESWPGSRRAWTVLWTPTMATSRKGWLTAARMSCLDGGAEPEALHLAARGQGEFVDEDHRARHLVIRHVLPTPRDDGRLVHLGAGAGNDIGPSNLAEPFVGNTDHRHLADARMRERECPRSRRGRR